MSLLLLLEPGDNPWIAMPTVWPNAEYTEPMWFGAVVRNEVWRKGSSTRGTLYSMAVTRFTETRVGSPMEATYVWLGDQALPPLVVDVEVYDAVGDPETTLVMLGRGDEPSSVGPVEVEPFEGASVGAGTRYLRRDKVRRGLRSSVVTGVRYVWRVAGTTDLVLTFECADDARFAAALPDVERLARTAHVASAQELADAEARTLEEAELLRQLEEQEARDDAALTGQD